MEIKEIIKELKIAKSYFESQHSRVGRAIDILEKVGEEGEEEPQIKIPKGLKQKRKNGNVDLRSFNKGNPNIRQIQSYTHRGPRSKITEKIGEFIKKKEGKSDSEIAEDISEKFDIKISPYSIKGYRIRHGIKGTGRGYKRKKKNPEENIDHSYEELTEEDFKNLKTKKKKKEINFDGIKTEIKNFILKSKEKRTWVLRDKIIDRFKVEIPTDRLSELISARGDIAERPKKKNLENFGQMHFDVGGKYSCNPSITAKSEKLTKDKNKVTCSNCKREMKQLYPKKKEDPEEDEEIDFSDEEDDLDAEE